MPTLSQLPNSPKFQDLVPESIKNFSNNNTTSRELNFVSTHKGNDVILQDVSDQTMTHLIKAKEAIVSIKYQDGIEFIGNQRVHIKLTEGQSNIDALSGKRMHYFLDSAKGTIKQNEYDKFNEIEQAVYRAKLSKGSFCGDVGRLLFAKLAAKDHSLPVHLAAWSNDHSVVIIGELDPKTNKPMDNAIVIDAWCLHPTPVLYKDSCFQDVKITKTAKPTTTQEGQELQKKMQTCLKESTEVFNNENKNRLLQKQDASKFITNQSINTYNNTINNFDISNEILLRTDKLWDHPSPYLNKSEQDSIHVYKNTNNNIMQTFDIHDEKYLNSVKKGRESLNNTDLNNIQTGFTQALLNNEVSINDLKNLLKADPKAMNATNNKGHSPIYYALNTYLGNERVLTNEETLLLKEKIDFMLNNKLEVNTSDPELLSLVIDSQNKNNDTYEILTKLVNKNSKINTFDKAGFTPLTKLLSYGDSTDEKAFDIITSHPKINVNKPDKNGTYPLFRALDIILQDKDIGFEDGKEEMFNTLINHEKVNLNITNPSTGKTPLMVLCEDNNASSVTHLATALINKMSAQDLIKQDNQGENALMKAIDSGHTKIANMILSKLQGEQLTQLDLKMDSVLIKAINNKENKTAKLILEKLPKESLTKPNIQGETAIMKAINSGNTEIAKLILAKLSNDDLLQLDFQRRSILMLAIENTNNDIAKLILERIPTKSLTNVDLQNNTPLSLAIKDNNEPILQLLLNKEGEHLRMPLTSLTDNKTNMRPETLLTWAEKQVDSQSFSGKMSRLFSSKEPSTPLSTISLNLLKHITTMSYLTQRTV
ncbi:ankyrin repeat domain-containing protein [uncultured Shewanella sp.]|uniref:ankyrin repeat domain-containing protein n=1 Tax=uncultured Shewanella sp. TaxID=173975 RepID=UPI00260C33E7|nr:ankyrin repeat domain-containing protein [uncultured Shewanella sp.]